ncbi:class I SAM-dependent methyltransferase [Rhizobium sp. NXC24]|uniref:class I SAM-dependent methyltransferase n=1 Tax=Rhizobium sp. NXC24 TaxID=2048897 RepID=UPI000CDF55A8|nr:class I SAM-dependent methyltransferase [Rhizobium sp. NXC24]AVA25736.1 SAM-dependent methyltransferase protein [Rhizobium sp. NXC24]
MKHASLQHFFSNVEKSSDKWALYLETYESLFASFRDRPISILEIGIQNGGFTETLAAYFPNATRIVGCDIDEKCGQLVFSDPRISVIVGDASNSETAARINGLSDHFDIIIDDGSHTSKDIVAAFCHYFPKLREEGVFIAEDLHCSYWYEYEGGLAHPFSSMSFFKLLTDVINFEHWGVPQSRQRLLMEVLDHHGFAVDEDELAKISSVEFFNSVSIVRKRAAASAMLGKRLVSGREFSVADNAPYNLSDAFRNDQRGNPFSDLDLISNKHVFGILAGLFSNQEVNKSEQIEVKRKLDSLKEETTATAMMQRAEIIERLGTLETKMVQAAMAHYTDVAEKLATMAAKIEDSRRPRTFFEWLHRKLRPERR